MWFLVTNYLRIVDLYIQIIHNSKYVVSQNIPWIGFAVQVEFCIILHIVFRVFEDSVLLYDYMFIFFIRV